MPFALLSGSPCCFYCGVKSNQSSKVRQFQCPHCEATNYLDENGQVTDPPPQVTPLPASSIRYARAAARSPSPTSGTGDIFCRTCLQNQHLVKENLGAYLPAEDDPQYEQYLATYDSYRTAQEQRYPQVCSQCAPKARERIKKSAYVAQTDHLRRMTERTRETGGRSRRWEWLVDLVIRLSGFGWTLSALAQTCWHCAVALSCSKQDLRNCLRKDTGLTSIDACLRQASSDLGFSPVCLTILDVAMPEILLIGLLTVWWNNWLRIGYTKAGGVVTRLSDYYTLQIIILMVRTAAWYILDPANARLDDDILKGGHLFMTLLIPTVYSISARTIQVDKKSKISFHLSSDSVLPNVATTVQHPAISTALPSTDSPQSFPIHRLTSRSAFRRTPAHVQTLLSEDNRNDPDVMDWTPSTRPIHLGGANARIPVIHHTSQLTGPSPLRGNLSPTPMSFAQRLRSPSAVPVNSFQKATEAQQNTFLASVASGAQTSRHQLPGHTLMHSEPYDSDMTATDTEDEDELKTPVSRRRAELQLATPKFFAPKDYVRKTGLEDRFEEAFSIKDAPLVGGQGLAMGSPVHGDNWLHSRNQSAVHHDEGEENEARKAVNEGSSIGSVLLVVLVSLVILGFASTVVKGGWL